MPKKVEKPKAEVSATSTVDPFESIVDAQAAQKKAAAPRKPRVAKAAKPVKAEAAFAETAEKPVEPTRKVKVIKAKDRDGRTAAACRQGRGRKEDCEGRCFKEDRKAC